MQEYKLVNSQSQDRGMNRTLKCSGATVMLTFSPHTISSQPSGGLMMKFWTTAVRNR